VERQRRDEREIRPIDRPDVSGGTASVVPGGPFDGEAR
jgi:hypothetical protein